MSTLLVNSVSNIPIIIGLSVVFRMELHVTLHVLSGQRLQPFHIAQMFHPTLVELLKTWQDSMLQSPPAKMYHNSVIDESIKTYFN